jgi:predicted  nucleic acid-binding Zn-ribbon protein
VPPKPEEPDNCCMSGCVNCVWDRFRDELEEWAAAAAEARSKEVKMNVKEPAVSSGSMDDDGGGSEGLWSLDEIKTSKGAAKKEEDLFEGIPIGIRAFMENERKLKARRKARGEASSGIVDTESKAKWLS